MEFIMITLVARMTAKRGTANPAIVTGVAKAPARHPTCLTRLLPKKMITKVDIPEMLRQQSYLQKR